MKKLVTLALAIMLGLTCLGFTACKKDEIIVQTNAFFAPFEYYEKTEIKGVDVDIMELVGKKLNKKIKFVNTEFSAIIDNVAAGKVCDAGAAGITVTDARKEKVDFSNEYYTSVQYVIYKEGTVTVNGEGDNSYILWSDLANKKIGVQLDTTGNIYVDLEINGEGTEGEEDYYKGELNGKGSTCTTYDNAQLAADSITAKQIDVVVVDELPATFICDKNESLKCAPLHYDAETATEEQYAICVSKGNTELLTAINEVLSDLLKVDSTTNESGITALVKKHMGLN